MAFSSAIKLLVKRRALEVFQETGVKVHKTKCILNVCLASVKNLSESNY